MIELILALIIGYFIGFFHRKGIEAKKREKIKQLIIKLKSEARKNRLEKNI